MTTKTPEERIATLEGEVETMLGIIAGMNVAVWSLIAKHPDHEALIEHLRLATEIADKPDGILSKLGPERREVALTVLENMQGLTAARGRANLPTWPPK